MTFEKRITIGVDDIKAVVIVCRSCGMRLSYGPREKIQLPMSCPNAHCAKVWLPPFAEHTQVPSQPATVKLIRAIAAVLDEREVLDANLGSSTGFDVRLEFEEPKT